MLHIRDLAAGERAWANQFLLDEFGSLRIVTRGRLHQARAPRLACRAAGPGATGLGVA